MCFEQLKTRRSGGVDGVFALSRESTVLPGCIYSWNTCTLAWLRRQLPVRGKRAGWRLSLYPHVRFFRSFLEFISKRSRNFSFALPSRPKNCILNHKYIYLKHLPGLQIINSFKLKIATKRRKSILLSRR